LSTYTPQPDDDELVHIREAASILHTPVKTLYNWCSASRRGQVKGPPFVKMGRRLQFRKGDLRRFVHENYHGTNGDA
jgi:hypothetical protein